MRGISLFLRIYAGSYAFRTIQMWVASATAMQQLLLINTISKATANEMLCIKKKLVWSTSADSVLKGN